MTNRFTASESYEAWQSGEPITIEPDAAEKLCQEHGADFEDFLTEQHDGQPQNTYDSWLLLGWLGY